MQSDPSSCPVCRGSSAPLGMRGRFELRRCASCHHSFTREEPTEAELAAVYERYVYDDLGLGDVPPFIIDLLGDLVATFEPHRGTGRLLDVGFGQGALLAVAKKHGWSTYGIEASTAAVEQGNKHAIGELAVGDFLDAPWPDGTFDVIVMTELIEHLASPRGFLEKARRLLRPGGMLYLTTPHGYGLSGRICGGEWSVLGPPEHLQLYSVSSMKRTLEAAGFGDANVYTQGVLPHEIVQHLRERARSIVGAGEKRNGDATTPRDNPGRTAAAYAVNAALSKRRAGQIVKSIANRVMRWTSLGDGLRIYAVR